MVFPVAIVFAHFSGELRVSGWGMRTDKSAGSFQVTLNIFLGDQLLQVVVGGIGFFENSVGVILANQRSQVDLLADSRPAG